MNLTAWDDKYSAVVSVSRSDFDQLKKYDFRNENQNYFSYLKCKNLF